MTVVRPVFALLGEPDTVAVSAKQLTIERIDLTTATDANWHWHSQLPDIGGLGFGDRLWCYGAVFDNGLYGVAIWTRPIAANRMRRPTEHLLELRRLAIPEYAPKYTATRMLGRMARTIRSTDSNVCTLLSYQMTDIHSGTIYKAANWTAVNQQTTHQTWNTHTRHRPADQSTAPKVRWEYPIRKCVCSEVLK